MLMLSANPALTDRTTAWRPYGPQNGVGSNRCKMDNDYHLT